MKLCSVPRDWHKRYIRCEVLRCFFIPLLRGQCEAGVPPAVWPWLRTGHVSIRYGGYETGGDTHRHQYEPAAKFHFNHFFCISHVVTWSGGENWQHCHRIVLFVNSLGMEWLGLNLSSDRVNSLFFTLNQRMKNNLSGNCE